MSQKEIYSKAVAMKVVEKNLASLCQQAVVLYSAAAKHTKKDLVTRAESMVQYYKDAVFLGHGNFVQNFVPTAAVHHSGPSPTKPLSFLLPT